MIFELVVVDLFVPDEIDGVERVALLRDLRATEGEQGEEQSEERQPVRFGAIRAGRSRMRPPLAIFCLFTAGCSASLPQPRQAASPGDSFIEVPYPPPAALSELVSKRPARKDAVFQDGGWTWRGRYFVWQRGGWVAPAPGMRFCPWSFHYLDDGRALFSPSHWIDAQGLATRPPVILVPSVTPPNEVTAEFQTGR